MCYGDIYLVQNSMNSKHYYYYCYLVTTEFDNIKLIEGH